MLPDPYRGLAEADGAFVGTLTATDRGIPVDNTGTLIDYAFDVEAAIKGEIGDTITPGQYPDVLAFANWCIEQRLESNQALAVAEKLFTRAAATAPDDPAPRLGLARCYEAGFEFEKAFQEYQKLLSQFGHHALVHVQLAALEARGVAFSGQPQRIHRDEAGHFGPPGNEEWMTFFKDPDGNQLALAEQRTPV